MRTNYATLLKKAEQYIAVSLWKPDAIFTKAKGATIWLDDKAYLDFAGGPGVSNIGYNHPRVLKAVRRVIARDEAGWGGNMLLNKYQVLLAEKLCQLTPGKFSKKVFFSNSGGEAVEAAILACLRRRPERNGMLSFVGDFHGRLGFGRTATTSRPMHIEGLPRGIQKSFFLPFPAENPETPAKNKFAENVSTPDQYLNCAESIIGPFVNEIGFALIELVQGEGGINQAKKDTLQALFRYLRNNNIWVIVDEVQTGLGRTGEMWASELYEVEPDIITVAKALSGGVVPIGATILSEELVYKKLSEHCNTFGGGPLACAAGLKVLDVMRDENLVQASKMKGDFLRHQLKIAKSDIPGVSELISDISGYGLMDRATFRTLDGKMSASRVRDMVMVEAVAGGLFLMSAGECSIRLMPPLTISNGEMEKAIDILIKAICRVHAKLFS